MPVSAPPYSRPHSQSHTGLGRLAVFGLAALAVTALSAASLPAAQAQQTGPALDLKRVLLSTGGVGYFEYEAEVEGDAELPLEVRLDQVNDVLKSIVVYDDQGTIGQISLPGKQPLEQVFRELPFGPQHLTSPVALLNALRGAEVEVTGAAGARGRLLSVTAEQVQIGDRASTVQRHRLTLQTEAGLQQVILEDVAALQFRDTALQAQVTQALAAVAENAAQDRRRLTVSLSGEGRRTVRVAYVAETPLWKTAYRLTLPRAEDPDEAMLQGWAVVENMSGEDWDNVELTLVSGNPVTLRQALYESYYVDRPEVPVEVMGRVLPGVDDGDMSAPTMAMADAARPESEQMKARSSRGIPTQMGGGGVMGTFSAAPMPAEAPAPAQVRAAASSEATTQVIFTMPTPVTVASGHSVMVPIANRRVPAERIALYQPQTHETHPLAAVRLTNDGETGLPPGVLTLYEQGAGGASFVGDARLDALPAGEERMVSFALDQKTRIDADKRSDQEVVSGRIVDGVLELTKSARQEGILTIKAPARESRRLVVEYPRPSGWDLVEPAPKDARITEGMWRLSWDLKAGEERTVRIVLRRPISERVSLASTSPQHIAVYLRMQELSEPVRDALARIRDLMQTVREAETTLNRLTEQREQTIAAQGRIRENLGAVPREGDLYRRYLDKLGEQEDDLERLAADRQAAQTALDAARAELGDYVSDLTL